MIGPACRVASSLLTGDELLDGRTRDTNGAFLTAQLTREGVQVVRLVVAARRPRRRSPARCATRSPLEPAVVIVSGGLGTTHDDLTAAALAEATGRVLEEHPEALEMVARRTRDVAERRRLDYDADLRAARGVRRCCRAGRDLCLRPGSRPGSPCATVAHALYALPGVPSELRAMWTVGPRRARRGRRARRRRHAARARVRRRRAAGGRRRRRRPAATRSTSAINVGGGEVAVRLRHERDLRRRRREADALVAALRAAVPVFSRRRAHRRRAASPTPCARAAPRVAVAESCTGGLLGGRLTALPGQLRLLRSAASSPTRTRSSRRCWASPSDSSRRHGAVSAEVAEAMAAASGASPAPTFGLSTTGIAGPGRRDRRQAGRPRLPRLRRPGGCRSVRERFPGDRDAVREWAVTRALHLLREALDDLRQVAMSRTWADETKRLFVACDLPHAAAVAIGRWQDASCAGTTSSGSHRALHLTLCFLGDVAAERIAGDRGRPWRGHASRPSSWRSPSRSSCPSAARKRVVALRAGRPRRGARRPAGRRVRATSPSAASTSPRSGPSCRTSRSPGSAVQVNLFPCKMSTSAVWRAPDGPV